MAFSWSFHYVSQAWLMERTIGVGQEALSNGKGRLCEKYVNRQSQSPSRTALPIGKMATR